MALFGAFLIFGLHGGLINTNGKGQKSKIYTKRTMMPDAQRIDAAYGIERSKLKFGKLTFSGPSLARKNK